MVNGTEYYPEGTVLNIELRKRETGEVLVDSTRTTVFGEDIIITAFYTGDIIIPMKPLTEKEREPAPEGYKKVRFINFIKDEGFLGGKTLKLEVYGVYPYEGGSRPEDETMTDNPIYVIENIPPDDFSPFINIPELETVSRETGLDIQQTVAKIYDAETGELLSDAYVEEGEIFPGFPSFGIKRNVRGEKQIGNLISAGNNNAATLQFQSSFYEEVGYVYSQLIIEALSE
ncbi:hypothetical protein LS482_00220 [Sinomicrobium kalidii]|uniref:hypothetical protein n=1 Tax=Sinomicrobium kalidii TaxID=2900738 RepID=UPI001E31C80D|nr:hypothetical protein [Sinomicrobium kalidii]UGU16309.1 hypothetical protein LS482_00220 [Sinomicrobium kalidii]